MPWSRGRSSETGYRSSPILHLLVDMTGGTQDKVLKRVVATGAVAWGLSLVAYVVMGSVIAGGAGVRGVGGGGRAGGPGAAIGAALAGMTSAPATTGAQGLAWRTEYLTALKQAVRISPVVILPPALVVALAALKVPVRKCLTLGLLAGVAIALVYQGESPVALVRYAAVGFRGQGYPPIIAGVLQSGGVAGALNMVLMMLFAGMYTGIMEASGMMADISRGLIERISSQASLLAGAMALSAASAVLASNQALAVVIPARVLRDKSRELDVRPEALAGALADSGVALAGIIPWNVLAAITGQALQCPVMAYAPYAFLVLLHPAVGAGLIFAEAARRRADSKRAGDTSPQEGIQV